MSLDELVSAILSHAPRDKWVTADDIIKMFELESVDRKAAVEALKKLENQGEGRYIVGRGTFPTRLEWGRSRAASYEDALSAKRVQTPSGNGHTIYIDYICPLDNNRDARLRLPRDLSHEEAEDISQFVKALVRRRTEAG
jgi:hypothetical protein